MVTWLDLIGQFFGKLNLIREIVAGLSAKVMLKFSGDPFEEVSRNNFGNNFGPGLYFMDDLCS